MERRAGFIVLSAAANAHVGGRHSIRPIHGGTAGFTIAAVSARTALIPLDGNDFAYDDDPTLRSGLPPAAAPSALSRSCRRAASRRGATHGRSRQQTGRAIMR